MSAGAGGVPVIADVLRNEVHVRLDLSGIEPPEAVLLRVGRDHKIAHDIEFGRNHFRLEALNKLQFVLRRFGGIIQRKLPSLHGRAHETPDHLWVLRKVLFGHADSV